MHHGTSEGAAGPLEEIFRQLNFKPLVFGTFGEMSSNVGDLVETAVEYRIKQPRKEYGGDNDVDSQSDAHTHIQGATVYNRLGGVCGPTS